MHLARVRNDRDSARAVYKAYRLFRVYPFEIGIRGFPCADETLERIASVGRKAVFYKQVCYRQARHRSPAGQFALRNIVPESAQLFNYRRSSLRSFLHLPPQRLAKLCVLHIKIEPEHVNLFLAVPCVYLYAAYHGHPKLFSLIRRFEAARERVMVRQRQKLNARIVRRSNNLARRKRPVGHIGMCMQIGFHSILL